MAHGMVLLLNMSEYGSHIIIVRNLMMVTKRLKAPGKSVVYIVVYFVD